MAARSPTRRSLTLAVLALGAAVGLFLWTFLAAPAFPVPATAYRASAQCFLFTDSRGEGNWRHMLGDGMCGVLASFGDQWPGDAAASTVSTSSTPAYPLRASGNGR